MTNLTQAVDSLPQAEDIKKRVQQYVQIRDALKAMDDAHEERRKPLLEVQQSLAGILQEALTNSKATSIATEAGTCYESTRYSTSLADPDMFMKWVVEKQAFDMLDRKANATAVKEYTKEHGALPPGVNLTAIKTVGVRRK